MFKKKRFYILTVQYKDKYTSNIKAVTNYGIVKQGLFESEDSVFKDIFEYLSELNEFDKDGTIILNYYISE